MNSSPIFRLLAVFFAAASVGFAKPALYIIGDSTVRNQTAGQRGWGDPLAEKFDAAKIGVLNRAIGGRSSRTFLTEGRWAAVAAHLKPGDFVIMQFGHNDGGPLNAERARASIKGVGDETEDIVRASDGQPETVHSFGWYLRTYVRETKAKGATAVVLSLIPRNIWNDGKIVRAEKDYGLWAKQAAEAEGALFIDFNGLLADRYEALGPEKTAALFCGTDHTHTGPDGAEFNAVALAEALRKLPGCDLGGMLLPDGLWLPSIFSDHMVLQRDMKVPVWGTAAPGAEIRMKMGNDETTCKADAHGCWKTSLPAMPAGGPFDLTLSGGGETRVIHDILSGEVWLCSGQSNMDFTLAKTEKRRFAGVTDWEKEVAAANHPRIRMFTAEWTMRESPQRDVVGRWAVCTPENAGDFSAVAYYFGRELHQRLDVPVGLIASAYGASTIEAWISEPALAKHPQFKPLLDAFAKKRLQFRDDPKAFENYAKALANAKPGKPPKNPDPVQDQHNPFVLHNGMIAPIAPYALRGAIWYQGESNLGTRALYPDLQKTLIGEWRELWGNREMPFYYVQLAPYKNPSDKPGSGGQLAEMREAQAKSLEIERTGMAVTLDIGDAKDVHPRNKHDVGLRLAKIAMTDVYAVPGVSRGPLFHEAAVENGRIRVRFQQGCGPLRAKDGPLKQFAIAGLDRRFVEAAAVIEGDSVVVSSLEVPQPAFVRYAWADNPEGANLTNEAGLPAAPFRSDR
ncbi:MAG: hypothetical protein J0M04_07620 [Verrucomicrobia bacterium]|nr:hypothetical protein [Verrucomicrobiota bacterium]